MRPSEEALGSTGSAGGATHTAAVPAAAPSPSASGGGTGASSTGRVLVVDDEAHIRAVLEDALTDEGYEVRSASHGQEALDLLRAWPADVVLLDMMLPIMDGWTFLEERRRLGVAPRTRVVAVSASNRMRDVQPVSLGIQAVVAKPFDLGHLLDTVAQLTRG